ncbi:MAG: MBL fold metallo-hydrolase [Bdellovibrionales bacterium]|nr:MBL fold metallo-hydrolase [Bdellovibrionales bacterium]
MQSGKMRVTVLGCGTSTGVPLIHCSCKVCRSRNPKNKRLRASIWIQVDAISLLVDVSPDFRQQALRARIPSIHAILLTHPHADHIGGIDEIRSYNFIQNSTIPAYVHDWTLRELPVRFPYIFSPGKVEGGGIAKIDLRPFGLRDPDFRVGDLKIIPIELDHGSKKVAGFRIGNFAYLTDCSSIPESSLERLRGLSVLMLDCLRLTDHDTHLSLERSLNYSNRIGAKRTFFTHLGHDFDFVAASRALPEKHALAYDGQVIHVSK